MIPVVAIVGKSGSGKTVLMEKLIAEFKSRGLKVAAIKHAHQMVEMDTTGKDTWRFSQAGSDATVIASPSRITVFANVKAEPGLDDAVKTLGQGYDIILAEGFKSTKLPKIEVLKGDGEAPVFKEAELYAVVSDEKLKFKIPRFERDDVEGIADFIEKDIVDNMPTDMEVTVNGKLIFLKPFVKDIIASSILAMLSTLKKVGIIRRVTILIRNKT
jgi:molybdopterin-guanine dinucleotide biosynthesis adapter protein